MDRQLKSGQTYHFATLDGLRGVAALLVLLGHATAIDLSPALTLVPRKLLAVEFFFMLSGFVVAYAYEDRFRAGFSVREFLLRRAVRLYPMIVVGACLGTIQCAVALPAF